MEDGSPVSYHALKGGLLWAAFKDMLGISECITFLFDLSNFVHSVDFPVLDVLFTKEEIDKAVRNMPVEHVHRPDGFNGFFMKKCWSVIWADFYRLCAQFCEGSIGLECINNSFIALIPKRDNPMTINDFRPISLLHYSLKLLTKLVADRLQS